MYFEDENTTENDVYGTELAEMSNSSAVFIKIPYNADREKSPWAEESVVPAAKLLSDNPALAYNIPVGKAAAVLCDWHGNEFFRLGGEVKAPELDGMIKKIADKAEDQNKKLQKNLDAAKASWEKQDRAAALKSILKNFKEDVVGLPAQVETIQLYHEILDAARTEIKAAQESGNKETLSKLAKDLKGTDAAKEAEEALKGLN